MERYFYGYISEIDTFKGLTTLPHQHNGGNFLHSCATYRLRTAHVPSSKTNAIVDLILI